jgi:hypothetical protein
MKRTLTDVLFALDAEIHPFLEINRARSILRETIASARPLLYYSRTLKSNAFLMNRIVFRDLKIRCVPDNLDNDFSLTSVLNHRSASCLGTVLASLAVAELLRVPVRAALYGAHFGLRFIGDGGTLDIEPPCRTTEEHVPADYGTPITMEQFLAALRERRAGAGNQTARRERATNRPPRAFRPR